MYSSSQCRTTWLSCSMFVVAISIADTSTKAVAEMQCARNGASIRYPTADGFYSEETETWARVTSARYLEGSDDSACIDVTVSGYEGFPTKKCSYKSADAGADAYP